jgi:hypothetical protein
MQLSPMENASQHPQQALPSRLPVKLERGALQQPLKVLFKMHRMGFVPLQLVPTITTAPRC